MGLSCGTGLSLGVGKRCLKVRTGASPYGGIAQWLVGFYHYVDREEVTSWRCPRDCL